MFLCRNILYTMIKFIKSRISRYILHLLGWKITIPFPKNITKGILITYPHTSYWDFFYGMLSIAAYNIPAKYALKKEIMFFPFNIFFRTLGAVPIQRKSMQAKIKISTYLIRYLQSASHAFLVIMPEGTRSKVSSWKLGFYKMALHAKVPIVLTTIDYSKKEIGILSTLVPTGNLEEDMQKIQQYYKGRKGKHPEKSIQY